MNLGRVATSGALFLAMACSPREPHKIRDVAQAPRRSEPTHYLNEWFHVGAARCRLQQLERAITEASQVEPGRVAQDIYVVAARLACEDEAGRALSARTALAPATRLAWLDERADEHPPSLRTELSKQGSDEQLLFEVPARDEGLLFARSYDAATGDPLGARERRTARLLIELPNTKIAVAPWQRGHDRALDLLLDRLARTLASGAPFDTLSETSEAHAAIETAAELYTRALVRLAPKQLTVRTLDIERPPPRVTLALEQSSAVSLVSFTFELTTDREHPGIARLVDEADTRAALECGEAKRELAVQALAARKQQPEAELCNVLATLLPGPCSAVDPALLSSALDVGARCVAQPRVRPQALPPADFAVRLQRGRSLTNLDPAPRYTLAVERSGRVTFRGEQWLSSRATSEGRSAPALVATLYDAIVRSHFLDRPARLEGSCKVSDERGDTLFVRANGRERSVRDRDGCRGPFTREELATLRQTLEQTTAASAWTTPNSNPKERDPDIWIVAAE